jgi:predicted metal-dependent peptidase
MGTDGRHLFYHPDFIKKVSIGELQGVIAHEIGHCILNHLPRMQGREHDRWNVAADLAVNPIILREFKLPSGALQDPQYADKSAEWIYSNLPMSKTKGQNTLDSHEGWKNFGKDGKDKDANGQDDPSDNSTQDDLEQEWAQRVAIAANQAKVQGKLPAHLESLIGELLQPKLDWKSLLQDRISSCARNDFRLSPNNKKHLYRGIYLPSIGGEEINIAVGIDTSGSIADEDIRTFLSEVKGICDAYEEYTIHLFFADAAIQKKFELHSFDELPTIAPGRGGTDFRPVIEEASKLDVTSIVYFTDGYGSFPDHEPNIPVIWVSTSNGGVKYPWGSVIEYPMDGPSGRRRR